MRLCDKTICIECLGSAEFFKKIYTLSEMRKMGCRYICTDFESEISVYEVKATGELIAVED